MAIRIPSQCLEIASEQNGIITCQQALGYGLTHAQICWLIEDDRWQAVHRGVYAVFTGSIPRQTALWAAVLRAGQGAMLSHQTAAELWGLVDQRYRLIQVTVPFERRPDPIQGVRIHRSRRAASMAHPALLPPRTRLEETVLDLVDQAPAFDAAFSYLCAGVQRGLTTSDRLERAASLRPRLRWRRHVEAILADVGGGVHSWLELRYVYDVERPHGLPRASRQHRVILGARSGYLDNLYEDYGVCVEADGRIAHSADQRRNDKRRDNAVAATGIQPLRYDWSDIISRPCFVAKQIAEVLATHGWEGRPTPCSPGCEVAGTR